MISSKFVAIYIGPVGIGVINILQNTLSIIASITGLGINSSGVRMIALSNSQNDENEFSKTILTLKRWSIATGIFGVLLTLVLAEPLSLITFGSDQYTNWFLILSINFIFSTLAVNKMVLLQGIRAMKKIAIASVVFAIAITLITIPIYYFFKMEGIVAVLVLTSILNYSVNTFFARKIKILPVQLSLNETLVRGKEMIQLGFLLSINVIFGQIISYLIKIYLNYQSVSESVLGLYVVASTILISYVGMIFNAMSIDFYPRLTIIQNNDSQIKELVNDQIEIALLLITPLILVFYFLAPQIIKILYSDDFIDVIIILKFALLAIIVKAIMWPLAFIILAKGEKKLYFKQEILSHSLNIIFTILFYRYIGLIGIGLAILLNYILYGIYVYSTVNKYFNFNFRRNTLLIIKNSLFLGIIASVIVLFIDYPDAYWLLSVLSIISFYYSYVQLNKRIDLKFYLQKLKNMVKFK